MKMREVYIVIRQYIGIFFMVLSVLWLFLILSATVPDSLIQDNMEKSALYYTQSKAFAYCDGDRMNGMADNYADSIWVNIACYMGKGNPVVSSIDTRYYDGEQKGQNVGLYLAVTEEGTEANTDYTRYWHATAGLVRILHIFTDVNGIKYMGFVTALGLAATIMILLIKDGKDEAAIAFFLSLCIVKIWNIRLSMEYQPAFIISFFMCILYLLFEKKGNRPLAVLAVVSGELTAFFDFLTTETMTILLPLILIITVRAMDGRSGEWMESLKFVMMQGSLWLISYGMAFVVKWCLASLLTGENKFLTAFHAAGERVNGIVPAKTGMAQILAAPAANLSILFGSAKRIETMSLVFGILFLFSFLAVAIVFLWKGKEKNRTVTKILFLLGCVILARYIVLNNHSYLHAFFTYRGLVSLVMAMLSMIIINNRKCVIM